MDDQQFDRWTASLTQAGTRRAALRSLGAVLGLGGVSLFTMSTTARRKGHKGGKGHGGGNGGGGSSEVPPPNAPVPASARKVIGYYVGYEVDALPPAEIAWEALTHIAVGTVLPRSNGSLDLRLDLGSEADGQDLARDVAQQARAHGVVPLLMIGGEGARDSFKAASSNQLATFVTNLGAAMRELGFAGLDLDWEPIEGSDEAAFKNLVFALRSALPDAVLTVPVIPTTLTFPAVPGVLAQVAPYLDQLSLMTYSMEGAYEGWDAWHSSALHGASARTPSAVDVAVADVLAAGVPANKLGVGVGFFGDCWSAPVTGPGQAIRGAEIVATDSEMSYATIVADYLTPAAAHFDATAQVPYLSYDAGHGAKRCTYISYENAASIAAKGAWAQGMGLNGAIVWTINQGHERTQPAGQRDALLLAVRQAFGA